VANAGFTIPKKFSCFRAQFIGYTSGTVSAQGYLISTAAPQQVSGGVIGVITPQPSPSSSFATTITNATSTALEVARAAKSSAGNLYGFYCTAITPNSTATAGYCFGYNATACPANGVTPTAALILDVCQYDTTAKGCSLSRLPGPARNYSTGISICITTATSPFGAVISSGAGSNTAYFSVDYQ
jgi:hypothetical protein